MTQEQTDMPPVQRWAVKIEYKGTDFVGWQKQKSGLSVQSLIEEAAYYLADKTIVPSIVAGRTDSGVHALGQAAHLDFPKDKHFTRYSIREGLGYFLKPHPVVIVDAAPVDLTWNARFSALWRSYRYIILNRPARAALLDDYVWHIKSSLDIENMQQAANYLIGHHDFTSFRAAACQALSPIKTLDQLSIHRRKNIIIIKTKARSFLHHQVRNMVGTLVKVGQDRWTPEDVRHILNAKDRCKAGPTAPASGLYLKSVGYDPDPFNQT